MNPHDCNNHKILSLARLPVPTLPHIFDFLSLVSRDFDIISNQTKYVNTYFYFLHIFYEPQLSFYSGNEFKRTKRFGHIIIAPKVNPVILSVSSSFAVNMIMGYVCFSRIFWQRENPQYRVHRQQQEVFRSSCSLHSFYIYQLSITNSVFELTKKFQKYIKILLICFILFLFISSHNKAFHNLYYNASNHSLGFLHSRQIQK